METPPNFGGRILDVYLSLKCGKTKRWEEHLRVKRSGVVENEVYREVYNCTDIRKVKMLQNKTAYLNLDANGQNNQ
jgi:hypothetical protein